MGNGTKVALVALLILMVVVIAKFVKDDSSDPGDPGEGTPVAQGSATDGGTGGKNAALSTEKKVPNSSASKPRDDTMRSANTPNRRTEHSNATSRANVGGNSNTWGARRDRSSGHELATQPTTSNLPRPAVGGSRRPPLGFSSIDSDADRESRTTSPTATTEPRESEEVTRPSLDGVTQRPTATPLQDSETRLPPVSVVGERRREPSTTTTSRPSQNGAVPVKTTLPVRPSEAEEIAKATDMTTNDLSRKNRDPSQTLPGHLGAGDPRPKDPGFAKKKEPARESLATTPQTYVLAEGDSPWSVAKKFYGRGTLYQKLLDANPKVKFHVGKKITIPALPKEVLKPKNSKDTALSQKSSKSNRLKSLNPKSTPKTTEAIPKIDKKPGVRTYTVKKGDTLMEIAKRFYGRVGAYRRLQEANPHLKFTYLRAGETIKVPR